MSGASTKPTKPRNQSSRSPGEIDRDIGRRMRERREELGLTMEAIAARLGLTIHQIQKYETGVNRVGAARLLEISDVLDYPPMWFLTGKLAPAATRSPESAEVSRRQLADLIQLFVSRLDDDGRIAVIEFARHLAGTPKS